MLERSYSHFGIPLSDEVILTSVLYDVTMHPEEQCTQCHGTSFIADVHMDTHIRIQPGSSTERHFVVYNYFSTLHYTRKVPTFCCLQHCGLTCLDELSYVPTV